MGSQSPMRCRDFKYNACSVGVALFHRDMADGNINEITQGNAAFLLHATETNLDWLHEAYGELVVAAFGMSDLNSGQGG